MKNNLMTIMTVTSVLLMAAALYAGGIKSIVVHDSASVAAGATVYSSPIDLTKLDTAPSKLTVYHDISTGSSAAHTITWESCVKDCSQGLDANYFYAGTLVESGTKGTTTTFYGIDAPTLAAPWGRVKLVENGTGVSTVDTILNIK